MKIAVIGAGVSGLSAARFLKDECNVTIFEKEDRPGGLIRCEEPKGLFHICGGHVFNSKRQDVLDWFWQFFDKENDFVRADRNSVVFFNDQLKVPYPIENHVYLFDEKTQRAFINDILEIYKNEHNNPQNFEDFLRVRFGDTLYRLYFKPYNQKVWRRSLRDVPLSWLEGKLPMPTVEEMVYNNMNHVEEKQFVHSTFWYAKHHGSQFIASKLAEGLDIRYGKDVGNIHFDGSQWIVDGQKFDKVVFCGNIKDMVRSISGVDLSPFHEPVQRLQYHGTTSVFCEMDDNPYSWIYLPNDDCESHRMICTGNFSPYNNPEGIKTCTVEFTDEISEEEIMANLEKVPFHPQYITHRFNKYTYPIQDKGTKMLVGSIKKKLSPYGFYFTGRFADWEYYNMDMAMGAAMDLCKQKSLWKRN